MSQDFVPLNGLSLPQALQEASEKQCQFLVVPSQVTHLGTGGPGPPGFYLVRFEIKYKLIRVSDSRMVAKGSGDSTGSPDETMVHAMQQAAGLIVHDVAKAASQIGGGH